MKIAMLVAWVSAHTSVVCRHLQLAHALPTCAKKEDPGLDVFLPLEICNIFVWLVHVPVRNSYKMGPKTSYKWSEKAFHKWPYYIDEVPFPP